MNTPSLPREIIYSCFDCLIEDIDIKSNLWLLHLNKGLTEWLYLHLYRAVLIGSPRALRSFHASLSRNPYRARFVRKLVIELHLDPNDPTSEGDELSNMQSEVVRMCASLLEKFMFYSSLENAGLYRGMRYLTFPCVTEARGPGELFLNHAHSTCAWIILAISSAGIPCPDIREFISIPRLLASIEQSRPELGLPFSCDSWTNLRRLHVDLSAATANLFLYTPEFQSSPWQLMPLLREVSVLLECNPADIVTTVKSIYIPPSWTVFAVFFVPGWDDFLSRYILSRATFNTRFILANLSPTTMPDPTVTEQENELFSRAMAEVSVEAMNFAAGGWKCLWQKILAAVERRVLNSAIFHTLPVPIITPMD